MIQRNMIYLEQICGNNCTERNIAAYQYDGMDLENWKKNEPLCILTMNGGENMNFNLSGMSFDNALTMRDAIG